MGCTNYLGLFHKLLNPQDLKLCCGHCHATVSATGILTTKKLILIKFIHDFKKTAILGFSKYSFQIQCHSSKYSNSCQPLHFLK